MRPIETNPYCNRTLYALAHACSKRSSDLDAPMQRTPTERRALAQDTRYLLLAVARALDHPGTSVPHRPEHESRMVRELEEPFMAWYEKEVQALQLLVAERATHLLFGKVPDWQREQIREEIAGSAEALRSYLRNLDAKFGGKGSAGTTSSPTTAALNMSASVAEALGARAESVRSTQ
jgi:hypothetical protein